MKTTLLILLLAIGLFSCENSSTGPENETPSYTLLTEGYAAGAKVLLFVEKDPEMGFNRLFVSLKDSTTDEALDNAQVTFMPMMQMPTMTHSAPYENPIATTPVDGYWGGAVVFVMAGNWMLEVHVENGGVSDYVEFSVPVSGNSNVQVATGTDGTLYFLTLVEPAAPTVGMNTFMVAVHKRETMMSHPAVTALTLNMTPTMPSMGHGSPNNVNPTHFSEGHYEGEVNFTMSGDWEVALDFSEQQNLLGSIVFPINIQ